MNNQETFFVELKCENITMSFEGMDKTSVGSGNKLFHMEITCSIEHAGAKVMTEAHRLVNMFANVYTALTTPQITILKEDEYRVRKSKAARIRNERNLGPYADTTGYSSVAVETDQL